MKGITFQPYHIPLIVAGKKTETRRVMNPQPERGVVRVCPGSNGRVFANFETETSPGVGWLPIRQVKPRYHAGEVVYIKEAWKVGGWDNENGRIYIEFNGDFSPTNPRCLLATDDILTRYWLPNAHYPEERWRSPLFLLERFARHFIKIESVRPERLQDITEEGAIAEGCTMMVGVTAGGGMGLASAKYAYMKLWDSINGVGSWDRNEWVWVYQFKYLEVTP